MKNKSKSEGKRMYRGPLSTKFNYKVESILHFVPSCFYTGSCMMNTMDFNYKLRTLIG